MSISHISLFKRSNGYWYILYEEEGRTKWKSTGKRLKQEALSVLSDFKEHLQHRIPAVLFTEFVSQFKSLQANTLRQTTLQRIYSPAFNNFLAIGGNKGLTAYSLKDVEHFKAERQKTCSPVTVNIDFRALRAAFNLAIKWRLLNDNPFSHSSQVKQPETVPSHLTKQDFQKILAEVREPVLRDIYLFAVLTGMRQGEILKLSWSNVDFEHKLIQVASSGRFLTKTGKVRSIPMSDAVFELLSRRSLTSTGQYVFHKDGFPVTASYVCHKFKKYVRKLGLSEGFRFHSLRHTFATWLVQDGVPIYEVQKLLGHSSISVTQVYAHLRPEGLHNTVNRIHLPLN